MAGHAASAATSDIVIVGAGFAGLRCALELTRRGRTVRLLEASDRPGGRVATDVVDGFRLDRGFQVYLSAYSEGWTLFPQLDLEFRAFHAGALLRSEGGFRSLLDPRRHPLAWLAAQCGIGEYRGVPLRELWQMGRAVRAAHKGSDAELWSRSEVPAAERLAECGVSPEVVQSFFGPFLGGIFLDGTGRTSSRMMEFVLRCFAGGRALLPHGGMEALPRRLAALLPEGTMRTSAPVASVGAHEVVLSCGEVLSAEHIVIATDAGGAHRLLGGTGAPPRWNGSVTVWFDLPSSPVRNPLLMLAEHDARSARDDAPINHACVTSLVQPDLAPRGRTLLAACTAGWPALAGDPPEEGARAFDWQRCAPDHRDNAPLLRAVTAQMTEWFGTCVQTWRPLRVDRIAEALPSAVVDDAHRAPLSPHDRSGRHESGCWVCGDHRTDPSINGALRSGRLVAEGILAATS